MDIYRRTTNVRNVSIATNNVLQGDFKLNKSFLPSIHLLHSTYVPTQYHLETTSHYQMNYNLMGMIKDQELRPNTACACAEESIHDDVTARILTRKYQTLNIHRLCFVLPYLSK